MFILIMIIIRVNSVGLVDCVILQILQSLQSSNFQTKEWRQSQTWYINGKHNECEKYQKDLFQLIIKNNINYSDERIHLELNKIVSIKNPLKLNDGFEYTENFDGKFIDNNNIYHVNFKFICGDGGAQTRSLREVYHFIKAQANLKNNNFINILDGDSSFKHRQKFKSMKRNNIFIGDLNEFQIWWLLKSDL